LLFIKYIDIDLLQMMGGGFGVQHSWSSLLSCDVFML